MPNPVIYHGASNGNGPWPAAAAAPYVPSASVLSRSLWLPADVWAVNESNGQDNPPRIEWRNFGAGTGEWFLRCINFPLAGTGGSWAQTSFYLPPTADVVAGTLSFYLMWSIGNQAATGNATNWHMNYGRDEPGRGIQGSGPGTQVNQIAVANEYLYCGPFTMAPTRSAVPEALVGGRMYHMNVYRGDNTAEYSVYFFGVRCDYAVVP